VEKVVRSGEYQNASEAFRAALRILQQRREEDALRLKALRAQLKRESTRWLVVSLWRFQTRIWSLSAEFTRSNRQSCAMNNGAISYLATRPD